MLEAGCCVRERTGGVTGEMTSTGGRLMVEGGQGNAGGGTVEGWGGAGAGAGVGCLGKKKGNPYFADRLKLSDDLDR